MPGRDAPVEQESGRWRSIPLDAAGVPGMMNRKPPLTMTRARFLLASILLPAMALGLTAHAEVIRIVGSDTLLILNQEWARTHMERNPGVTVEVTGGGSGRGIKALLAGEADIAASSRLMTDGEVAAFKERSGGREPWRLVVARDGIGISLHSSNPVTQLSVDQLAGIFTGDIRRWSEVGGPDREIAVHTRDIESGTCLWLRDHVMGGRPFADSARTVSTTAMMTAMVSRDPRSIGYGGIAYSPGAQIIRIAPGDGEEAIWPNERNVMSREYPLSRPLQFYLNSTTMSQATEDFLRFVLDVDGQEIVRRVGYYPLDPLDVATREETGTLLTPETMDGRGFRISAEFQRGPEVLVGEGANRMNVRVRFDEGDGRIADVDRVLLNLAGNLSVPVEPVRDAETGTIQSVDFVMDLSLIAEAELILEAADEGTPARYRVPLREFNRAP